MFCKAKSATKKTFFARRFLKIFKLKCSNVRPLLYITFPQEFWISKNIGHSTSGSGGKKMFKRYLKSEHTKGQTDTQTDRRTDILTYRKHRPRGPMLWKVGNHGISCMISRKLLEFFEKILRKFWESFEKVLRKSCKSCERVVRKFWKSWYKVVRKMWESWKKVIF